MNYLAIAIFDTDEASKKKIEKIISNKDGPTSSYLSPENNKSDKLFGYFQSKLKGPLGNLSKKKIFSDWGILDVQTIENLTASNYDNLKKYPGAILTPGCRWLREPCSGANRRATEKALLDWDKRVKKLLGKYNKNGVAVFVNIEM